MLASDASSSQKSNVPSPPHARVHGLTDPLVSVPNEPTPAIILFIDSGTFREDYARIYDSLRESLLSRGFLVSTLLGPQATAREEERFAKYAPEFVNRLERSGATRARKYLFARALLRREIPINRRQPLLLLQHYRLFVSCLSWLESHNSRVVVSIKYDSCYPFVAAANSLGMHTVALQHGAYSFDPSAARPRARVHEWPASHILVWSDFWGAYHRAAFPEQAVFASVSAILWHAKYSVCQPARSDNIVIYESENWPEKTIQAIVQEVGEKRVRIKPHPWKQAQGLSRSGQRFPELVDESWLWESVPLVGVSLGSTVTDELIFLGVPSVNLVRSEDVGLRFPTAGSFPHDIESGSVVGFLQVLLKDEDALDELLQKQRCERGHVVVNSRPAVKIAEYCWSLAGGRDGIAKL